LAASYRTGSTTFSNLVVTDATLGAAARVDTGVTSERAIEAFIFVHYGLIIALEAFEVLGA
jgi:hypothetical protein